MSNALEALIAQALKLTPEERVRLANRLIASVFEDHEVEEAWAVEVERRVCHRVRTHACPPLRSS